jgi:hypothetical protein
MRRDEVIGYIWESGSLGARLVRALLWPLGWLYGAIIELRNAAFDRGIFSSYELSLPTISVGNLSVGGTGKTPVAAWLVRRLKAAGARPAIVLRGYGGDEPLVHARLNPGVPVIVNADRVAGVAEAKAAGANVVVLDDAFQHRRARRDVDAVLLSADRFGPVRPLPAGPWREPLVALARASLIAVTRKSASPLRARELLSYAMRFSPKAAGSILHLTPDALVQWSSGVAEPVASLSGAPILGVRDRGSARVRRATSGCGSAGGGRLISRSPRIFGGRGGVVGGASAGEDARRLHAQGRRQTGRDLASPSGADMVSFTTGHRRGGQRVVGSARGLGCLKSDVCPT